LIGPFTRCEADLGAALAELGNGSVGRMGHVHRFRGDLGPLVRAGRDVTNAGAKLFDALSDRFAILADLFGRLRNEFHLIGSLVGIGAHEHTGRLLFLSSAAQLGGVNPQLFHGRSHAFGRLIHGSPHLTQFGLAIQVQAVGQVLFGQRVQAGDALKERRRDASRYHEDKRRRDQ
jgi:hypothetical protein